MKTVWVVVANQSRARIFSLESPRGQWRELEDLVAPDVRLHDRELESDRPGHTVGAGGHGHTMRKRHSLKEQAAVRFASDMSERLTAGTGDGDVAALVLVAPPRFLGLLREALPQRVSSLVVHSLDKDLVSLRSEDIRAHLPERL